MTLTETAPQAAGPTPGRHGRIQTWARREFGYKPFLVLLGLGFLVRLAVAIMYFPAWMQANDVVRFARVNPSGMFDDYWMPAGYAFFVRGMRAITSELWITIAIQHLIGLAVGAIVFLTMKRLGAKEWVACIPAGFVFLSGDLLWTEHQLMAENFVTAFLVAGLGCAVRGLVPRVDSRWLLAASALLMYAALSRNVALVAMPVFLLCVAFQTTGSFVNRARVVAIAVLPATVVFGLYVTAFEVSDGKYLGMTNMSGWNLYSRVAPFADCTQFTPPAGTQQLCETTATGERDGSLGYEWDLNSRGNTVFTMEPPDSKIVGKFGREVIVHQPLAYLKMVGVEALRYLDSSIADERPYSGLSGSVQSFGLVDPATRERIESEMAPAYDGTHVRVIGRQILSTYQSLFRIGGLLVAALLILTVVGAFVARGAARLGIFLFGGTAVLLYLVPVATFAWEYRYGVQPQVFLVVAGVLGASALLSRRFPALLGDEGKGASPPGAATTARA
jgi:hypothetical protein